MRLNRLKLNNFRCYASLDQTFNTAITIIDGVNGSGKTALIEAIYWQTTGRSFRHHKSVDLIRHKQKQLTVFSEYQSIEQHQIHKLGVSYSKNNKKIIKHNGQIIRRQTDVAQQFPVIAIDPNAFLWIDHTPSFRRSYLDWLVFHVEPNYLRIWKQSQKVQQHLNKLLKSSVIDELDLWQQTYAQLAQHTTILREQVVEQIQQRFNKLIKLFLPTVEDVTITYNKGWLSDDLLQELSNKQSQHLKQGFIGIGVNKADLVCLVNGLPAQVVLSRGQKKLIAVIMYLVFIEIFENTHQQPPVICIDDIDSELDDRSLSLLATYIQQQPRQIFLTTVNANSIKKYFMDCEVFHVKQNNQNKSELYS